eukprot:8426051-Pyramimonas_sp.AAC.1
MVYVTSLHRAQEPSNIQVRRLNAITRKLQACPKKSVDQAMNPTGEVDLHSDSGYRRLSDTPTTTSKAMAFAGQTCYD